ncbi:hypothetical protein QTP88_014311 [Uroleucon formosanum]
MQFSSRLVGQKRIQNLRLRFPDNYSVTDIFSQVQLSDLLCAINSKRTTNACELFHSNASVVLCNTLPPCFLVSGFMFQIKHENEPATMIAVGMIINRKIIKYCKNHLGSLLLLFFFKKFTFFETRGVISHGCCLPLNSNLNNLSPLYLGTLQQLIFTTKRMVTHKIRNRGTRSAGPRYDDWSGSAGRGGNSGGGGDGTGAFSAQQAPRPDGLLVDSVGAFSSPVRTSINLYADTPIKGSHHPKMQEWTYYLVIELTHWQFTFPEKKIAQIILRHHAPAVILSMIFETISRQCRFSSMTCYRISTVKPITQLRNSIISNTNLTKNNVRQTKLGENLKYFPKTDHKKQKELSNTAVKFLVGFSTTYLCERGFSSLTYVKSKYRNKLNVEDDLRLYFPTETSSPISLIF